ncbi:MAG: CobW family GTP-binding protein [Hyphomicrobiales bacterium]
MNPLPLTVISGYLGAGKTTTVNQILAEADGRRIMVLVNDFGDIAIDEELIAAREGDTLSLSNGCVCCAITGDLFKAFSLALDRVPQPDHLVIEASGVAEPNRIANFARAEPDLRLDAIITVVDALNIRAHARDPMISQTIETQLASAGLLLITKHNLCSAGEINVLDGWLAEHWARIPIARAPANLDILLGPMPSDNVKQTHSHNHEELYERWAFKSSQTPDRHAISALLDALPEGILRLKGICVSTADAFEFHIAGQHQNVQTISSQSACGLRVVAIGLKNTLPKQELETHFSKLAEKTL